jgi:SPP1 family phage portal protein
MELVENGNYQSLSTDQLSNIISSQDITVYLNNKNYYEGKNTTLIEDTENNTKKPNNQIPLPFARKTVKDVVGYSGKPGKIQYIFDAEQDERSLEYYREVEKRSDLWITTSEEYQDGAIKGEGGELAWVDEDGITRLSKVDREQCIFEYTGLITDELHFSIRHYRIRDFDIQGNVVYTWHAFVYWKDHIDEYVGTMPTDGVGTIGEYDPQEKQRVNDRNKTGLTWKFVDTETHEMGRVPLYPMPMNSDNFGVFQASIPIIDRLDMFGSDSIANAIDRFQAAILTLSKKMDKDTAENISAKSIIDDLGDDGGFVKFVQRESDVDSSVTSFELFERLYYDLTGIPNMNDDKFGTKSGVAIAYALIPFENLVSEFEAYFSKGLRYRMSIINHMLELQGMQPLEFELKWERNLPFDLKNRVDVVVALKEVGLLSDETLIKMFPENIIKDAKAEMEQRDDEIKERMDKQIFAEEEAAKRQIVTTETLTAEPRDTTEGE